MSSGIIAAMEPFLLQKICKIRDLQFLPQKFSDFVMGKAHNLGFVMSHQKDSQGVEGIEA
jgi:hypothetical protein